MWNLKYDTVEPICETETRFTNVESRLVVTKGVGWEKNKKKCKRTSLAVQWLRPYTSSAGDTGSISGRETKFLCGTAKKNAGLQSHARVISYASKYLKIK